MKLIKRYKRFKTVKKHFSGRDDITVFRVITRSVRSDGTKIKNTMADYWFDVFDGKTNIYPFILNNNQEVMQLNPNE